MAFFLKKDRKRYVRMTEIRTLVISLDLPVLQSFLSNWRQVDSLQKPYQDAVAFVKLGVAFLADELGQPGVAVQLNSNQLLEVCVEEEGLAAPGVRILGSDTEGILRPREGVSQAARREFSVAEPADGGGQSTCWEKHGPMSHVHVHILSKLVLLDSPEDFALLSGCFCGTSPAAGLSFEASSLSKLTAATLWFFRGRPLLTRALLSSPAPPLVLLELGGLFFFFMVFDVVDLYWGRWTPAANLTVTSRIYLRPLFR